MDRVYDLAIVGGGINGAGIAADAAGRGLHVLLAEMGDLAGATSSQSSKLIHGGLRYLEHYEFRLVREALAEREVLLREGPAHHLAAALRAAAREGHAAARRSSAPASRSTIISPSAIAFRRSSALDLSRDPAGRALKPELDRMASPTGTAGSTTPASSSSTRALPPTTARRSLTRTQVVRDRELPTGSGMCRLPPAIGQRVVRARALVNAAGPWAGRRGAPARAPPRRP